MEIRANSWHLRIFLQAYVEDRYWLDTDMITFGDYPELPETVAYRTFYEECSGMPYGERYSHETLNKIKELSEASQLAYSKWYREQQTIYTSKRSHEVSERLAAGKMSLCPYFWSIVAALVFYYGCVRSTRPIRQFFERKVSVMERVATVALVSLLVSLGAYAVYENWDDIPTPSAMVADISNEYRSYKERQRQVAEFQESQRQRQLEFERANPDEAARRREQEEQQQARTRAAEWEEWKRDSGDIVLTGIVLVGFLLFLAAFTALGYWLLFHLTPWIEKRLPSMEWVFRSVTGFSLFQRISRWRSRCRQFYRDTRELIVGFAKAKKERVCPYITVKNGANQH